MNLLQRQLRCSPALQRLIVAFGGLALIVLASFVGGSPALAGPHSGTCDWGLYAHAGEMKAGGACISPASVNLGVGGVTATASADFDGALHASVTTARQIPSCSPIFYSCYWGASASAYYYERVTFFSESGDDEDFDLRVHIDGSLDDGWLWGDAGAYGYFSISEDRSAWDNPMAMYFDGTDVDISRKIKLGGEEGVTYYIMMGLEVWANRSGSADYSNTMRLTWDLPPGVTYTSASGRFAPLSHGTPTAGVPEPATWAMMISGLTMVGATMRRRRHHRPVCVA